MRRALQRHAFPACPVAGSTTCSFIALGNRDEDCTATLETDGGISSTCITTRELSLIAP